MNVVLFGATGMVGQGVLRECLNSSEVELVHAVGRTPTGVLHPKLRESTLDAELPGFDGCFFCLGVSSAGMSEADYRRVTYDITLRAAEMLSRLNPEMTFIFVSGAGTDSSEKGPVMWARVKGQTENALLRLSFRAAYMFRPGVIQPLHGIRSKTASYRILYGITRPLLPLLRWLMPKYITTTEELGQAMIQVALHGFPKTILESADIAAAAHALVEHKRPN